MRAENLQLLLYIQWRVPSGSGGVRHYDHVAGLLLPIQQSRRLSGGIGRGRSDYEPGVMRSGAGPGVAGGRGAGPRVCARDRAQPSRRWFLRIGGGRRRKERVPDRLRARAVPLVPQPGRVCAMPRSYADDELYCAALYLYRSRILLAGMLLRIQHICDCGVQL